MILLPRSTFACKVCIIIMNLLFRIATAIIKPTGEITMPYPAVITNCAREMTNAATEYAREHHSRVFHVRVVMDTDVPSILVTV